MARVVAPCSAPLLSFTAPHSRSSSAAGAAHAQQSIHSKNQPTVTIGDVQHLLPRSATDGSLMHGLTVVTKTPAKVIVNYDEGGVIFAYNVRWKHVAAQGSQVEVRGMCWSACTLVAAHIPKDRLCFADYSSLNFHQARHGAPDDTPNPQATKWMFDAMPPEIENWIVARGGIEKMPVKTYWTLPARQLWTMGFRKCSD